MTILTHLGCPGDIDLGFRRMLLLEVLDSVLSNVNFDGLI